MNGRKRKRWTDWLTKYGHDCFYGKKPQRTSITKLKDKFARLKEEEKNRRKNDLMVRWINRIPPFTGTRAEAEAMGFKFKKDLHTSN